MTSIFKVPLFSAETAGQGLDLPGVLRAVIDSQRYVLGTQVLAFEAAFAAYVGVRHAIGVANGTDALEIALRLDMLLAQAGFRILGGTSLFRLASHEAAPEWFARLGQAGILVRQFRDPAAWLRFGLPGDEAGWARLEAAFRG